MRALSETQVEENLIQNLSYKYFHLHVMLIKDPEWQNYIDSTLKFYDPLQT